jgi:ABC-type antimicrobial peptide transport system permease subunit
MIGLFAAFAALATLNSLIQLEQISLLDARAFAGAVALVLAATAVAAYGPARRAARIDPAETLRADA